MNRVPAGFYGMHMLEEMRERRRVQREMLLAQQRQAARLQQEAQNLAEQLAPQLDIILNDDQLLDIFNGLYRYRHIDKGNGDGVHIWTTRLPLPALGDGGGDNLGNTPLQPIPQG